MVKNIFSLAFAICLFSVALAQEGFQGKVTFEYAYDNVPLDMKMKMMMSTNKEILNYSDSAWCMEHISTGGKRKLFNHFGADSLEVYASYFGFKAYLTFPLESEGDTAKPEVEEIKYFTKTKVIAGVECQLASVKYKGKDKPLPVFFAPNIPNVNLRDFPGLKGLPMMYATKWGEIEMSKKAISVEALDPNWDEKPKGYKRMSADELKGKFQGF